MAKIGFTFPIELSQQWEGFNDTGIETFSGSPFRSFGREATQNSLDASISGTVDCSVTSKVISTSEIPGLKDLKKTIALCVPAAKCESEKASAFFERATKLLSKKDISILQYSDSNTTGVVGPCENGTPYFALVKAKGQSVKQDGSATGSFGIGKFAPFTLSMLRTVFITTVWKDDDGDLQHYVQGKSILMSHEAGKDTRRGTGFWGIEKQCQPIIGLSKKIPNWLQRVENGNPVIGTTITILGFDPGKDWEIVVGSGIAESFFSAIQTKKITISIGQDISLTPETLGALFTDDAVIGAIGGQDGQPDQFIRSGYFLEALGTGNDVFTESHQNSVFGHMKLKILVREGLPKKVAVTRNGMLITSRLERLKNLGEFKGFVAVLECLSEEGNKLLRDMEPPAHDAFEPLRLQDLSQQKRARRELHKIAAWVKNMLRRHAQNPIKDVTEIDELAEFFSDENDNDDKKTGDTDGENPRGEITIRARPLPPRKISNYLPPTPSGGDEEGASDAPGAEGSGSESATELSSGDGSGDEKSGGSGDEKMTRKPFEIVNLRAIPLSSNERKIAFTPVPGGKVKIKLEESGADTDRGLKIKSANVGEIIDGCLVVDCVAKNRVAVDVVLSHEFNGSIKVTADAI